MRALAVTLLYFFFFNQRETNAYWTFGSMFPNPFTMQQQIFSDIVNMNRNINHNIGAHTSRVGGSGGGITSFSSFSSGFPSSTSVFHGGSSHGSFNTIITQNGDKIFKEVEEYVMDNKLYHVERTYNSVTGETKKTVYTIDLNDSNAKPVYIKTSSK